jgi:hypothetical protein
MDGPGRPTVMDENTLRILEDAFSNDATDIQACFLANIATSTLYKYQVDNPGYLERKQALKDMIKYQAKRIIKEAMFDKDKGTDTAKWYLERKDKGEFSQKVENDITSGGEKLNPILVKFIDGENKDNRNTEGV